MHEGYGDKANAIATRMERCDLTRVVCREVAKEVEIRLVVEVTEECLAE